MVQKIGQMWNALFWKGSNWATGSGVRIPVSPPGIYINYHQYIYKKNITSLIKNHIEYVYV